jgi:hypothetical protein
VSQVDNEVESAVLCNALSAVRTAHGAAERPPKLDLFRFAESLGIQVDVLELEGREAMYLRVGSQVRIILSRQLFYGSVLSLRGRFTLAHEIGHYFLDAVQLQSSYRAGLTESSRERIADFVASNVLVPRDLLREQLRTLQREWSEGDWVEAWTIVELQKRFFVSLPAIAHAIRELSPTTVIVRFDQKQRHSDRDLEYRVAWSSPVTQSGEKVFVNQSLRRCSGLDSVSARRRSVVATVLVNLRPLPVGQYWVATAIPRRHSEVPPSCLVSVFNGPRRTVSDDTSARFRSARVSSTNVQDPQ